MNVSYVTRPAAGAAGALLRTRSAFPCGCWPGPERYLSAAVARPDGRRRAVGYAERAR
jgi:hypothetical protein